MTDLNKNIESFEKFMNSEEGKKSVNDWFEARDREENNIDRRVEQLNSFISKATEEEIDILLFRFKKLEEAYTGRMLHNKFIETNTCMTSVVLGFFSKYGETISESARNFDFSILTKLTSLNKEELLELENKMKKYSPYLNPTEDDMFLSETYVYGKYILKTYIGQGWFFRIYKENKQII